MRFRLLCNTGRSSCRSALVAISSRGVVLAECLYANPDDQGTQILHPYHVDEFEGLQGSAWGLPRSWSGLLWPPQCGCSHAQGRGPQP